MALANQTFQNSIKLTDSQLSQRSKSSGKPLVEAKKESEKRKHMTQLRSPEGMDFVDLAGQYPEIKVQNVTLEQL